MQLTGIPGHLPGGLDAAIRHPERWISSHPKYLGTPNWVPLTPIIMGSVKNGVYLQIT